MTGLSLAAVLLAAAAFFAPVAKRLGLSSIVGYLIAGLLIGPSGFGLIFSEDEVDKILHVAEFGVVLLLFLIGLELRPQRLLAMRTDILGAGGLQVGLTTLLFVVAGRWLGWSWGEAIVVGGALSLSSTAFVLQFLGEKGHLTQRHGRLGFSILLFQDLAAIPLIALVPLLSPGGGADGMAVTDIGLALGTIGLVLVLGRYVLRYVYGFVAATGVPEGMTAAALLTVVCVALLMEQAGLSAALGAFLAGMLIGGSAYRHEIQANIKPFERILLGVFFTAVGMALELDMLLEDPGRILSLALGLMVLKGSVLFAVGLWRGMAISSSVLLAAALSQGGEFAFVLFAIAVQGELLGAGLANELAVAVTVSMALTPAVFWLAERALGAFGGSKEHEADDMPVHEPGHVIIAGFGPFGQIPARILSAKRIPFTALETSREHMDFVKRFGAEVYYGDPSRPELLEAAHADRARALVVAVDNPDHAAAIVETARTLYPNLPVYARARDRLAAYELLDLGATDVERETFQSALALTKRLLTGLGESPTEAKRAVNLFMENDERRFEDDYPHHKDEKLVVESARRAARTLEEQFQRDRDEEPSDGKAR